ncbi:MAG TPA: hypothetical protein VOA78_12780 [Candidatus Dormibacteraeota bacterium]|nr:hypothetical protein [Candidatus Dormibacteraeota bacterium]
MKTLACSAILVIAFFLNAQAPAAVPVAQEPHHHLVFENSYVRVLRVSIPANESTLLHQHDASYVYVSLGPADIVNAVQGKPEVHPKLTDGQVGYAKGGFAHVATAVGIPFNNVTIELLLPQGDPRNLCEKIVDGPLDACNQPTRSLPFKAKPLLETDEARVVRNSLAAKAHYTQPAKFGMLFVVLNDSELQIDVPGQPSKSLRGGEVFWLNPGDSAVLTGLVEQGTSNYLTLLFKDADAAAKP